jgi:hypothetical protein
LGAAVHSMCIHKLCRGNHSLLSTAHNLARAQSGRILYPREKRWKFLSSLGIRHPERTRQSGPLDMLTQAKSWAFYMAACASIHVIGDSDWQRCGGAALESMVPLLLASIHRMRATDYSSIIFRASPAREHGAGNKKIIEEKCD